MNYTCSHHGAVTWAISERLAEQWEKLVKYGQGTSERQQKKETLP